MSISNEATRRLWTWQGHDVQIDKGPVVLDSSTYLSVTPKQKPRYEAVHSSLGTDQLIWCHTVEKECNAKDSNGDDLVLWLLEVPLSEIACFVDEWLAERLIRNHPCPSIETWREWRREAVHQHPKRQDRQDQFIDCQLKQYAGDMLTPEEGWNGYFLGAPERCEWVTAVLYSPVNTDWITERPTV